jgi:hypothetical protein
MGTRWPLLGSKRQKEERAQSPSCPAAEIHECLDLRVGNDWIAVGVDAGGWIDATILWRRTSAERNLNHIQELTVDGRRLLTAVNLEVVLRQHHEMDLVLVEFVVLAGVVLDEPLLHGSLGGDDLAHCAPDAVPHAEALMKNALPSSTSSKNTVRVTEGVMLAMPPNRCLVVSTPVEAGTLSSAVGAGKAEASFMLSRGRVGASSPSGPEMIFWVTIWATLTLPAGAFTRNSTRAAGGKRKCDTGMRRPG